MKKLTVIIGLLLVAALLVFVSCASAPQSAGESKGSVSPTTPTIPTRQTIPPGPTSMVPPAPPPPVIVVERFSSGAPPPVIIALGEQLDTDRMIVRTANMQLVVDDVPVALDRIAEFAQGFGGYVVSSNRWGEAENLAGNIAIRVPAENFDRVMRSLRGLAVEVTSESTSSKDVTEEYIDLSAKLHNLEATEEQLLRLMEKAEKVEDILSVQRELFRTRGEIEQTQGRIQYLERTSDTSLIEVYLEQARLDVSFAADKRSVRASRKIQFTIRQVAGGFEPYSYQWDFGDGNTSTDRSPTHAYKTTGSYTVTLKVTDDRGNTATETREGYIFIVPGWSAGITASGAWNGLVTFGHVLANIFIWVGIFSPVWIVIGGIVYWLLRRRQRRKAK